MMRNGGGHRSKLLKFPDFQQYLNMERLASL